jgi:HK97 family phage prohead protease
MRATIMHRKQWQQTVKHRQVEFKADQVADDGTFSGYGSVFGVLDTYGEIVAPGAFKASIKAIKASGDPLPALWQHRSDEPIGGYTSIAEDERGLRVEGWLLKDAIPRAAQAHALMRARLVKGLSIGYYVLDDSWNDKEKTRTLKKLDLVEISIVTFPANPAAQIDAIKSRIARGDLPTLPEFERILREAGFSKTQSAVIANRGLRELLDRSESGEPETSETIAGILQGFTLPSF